MLNAREQLLMLQVCCGSQHGLLAGCPTCAPTPCTHWARPGAIGGPVTHNLHEESHLWVSMGMVVLVSPNPEDLNEVRHDYDLDVFLRLSIEGLACSTCCAIVGS